MRIALIHTKYLEKGGEDVVFLQESKLLEQSEEVFQLIFYNKSGIKGLLQFIMSVWNPWASSQVRRFIKKHKPDIIHVHNWHFAAGPVIFRAAGMEKVPVVATLHNYRILCPSATLIHNNKLFLNSIHAAFPWEAALRGVYRNSKLLTLWLGIITWVHKKAGTWKKVDRFIALTDVSKRIFTESSAGIPDSRITVKPNFVSQHEQKTQSHKRNKKFLFTGRLSPEKGILTLIEAFEETGFELVIAGAGPLAEDVKKASEKNRNIQYLGHVSRETISTLMAGCTALIFPSIWYETFGMVIIEAFASGCPVIASDIGSPKEIIQQGYNGLLFEAGNPGALKEAVRSWTNLTEGEKEIFGHNAFTTYCSFYTPEKNREQLLNIYESVLREKSSRQYES